VVDHISPERRSWLMSRVRSKHSSPEMRVRTTAHNMGLRFRLHRNDLPGKPDLVFPKYRVALFVHGCFWHRHEGCNKSTTPKSNVEFWESKFQKNTARDAQQKAELEKMGWHYVRVWECQTKSILDIQRFLVKHIAARQ
jgi:DNA mismatch endonuclease (patch repair protein)